MLGLFLMSCSNEDSTPLSIQTNPTDEANLIFMLEEEKLARDVYTELYKIYGSNQFNNIKESEQRHMNYVSDLLDSRNVDYTIEAPGVFNNSEIQSLYNQLMDMGKQNLTNAFLVGTTIEDVDIYDLRRLMDQTNDPAIISVFSKLECGSRNHMRAFTRALDNLNETYLPQYISESDYQDILNAGNGHCG